MSVSMIVVNRRGGIREQQRAQREHAQQRVLPVHDEEVIDELGGGSDFANLANRRFGGPMRVDPGIVRRHQAAGGIFRILHELAQLAGRVFAHLRKQLALAFLVEFRQQVRGVVRIHLLDDVGGALGADVVDQRLLRVGVEMFEGVGRRLVVELPHHRRRFGCGKIADDARRAPKDACGRACSP